MKHSKEQQIAIDHVDGPMMVLAGPGAGKTTVITHRVKKLIEKEGVNPAQILVVTFSKAAAVEMRERFEKITGGRRLPVRFGTFHSLFFQVLRNAYHYEAKDILSQRLKYRFLEEALMAKYQVTQHNTEKQERISEATAFPFIFFVSIDSSLSDYFSSLTSILRISLVRISSVISAIKSSKAT